MPFYLRITCVAFLICSCHGIFFKSGGFGLGHESSSGEWKAYFPKTYSPAHRYADYGYPSSQSHSSSKHFHHVKSHGSSEHFSSGGSHDSYSDGYFHGGEYSDGNSHPSHNTYGHYDSGRGQTHYDNGHDNGQYESGHTHGHYDDDGHYENEHGHGHHSHGDNGSYRSSQWPSSSDSEFSSSGSYHSSSNYQNHHSHHEPPPGSSYANSYSYPDPYSNSHSYSTSHSHSNSNLISGSYQPFYSNSHSSSASGSIIGSSSVGISPSYNSPSSAYSIRGGYSYPISSGNQIIQSSSGDTSGSSVSGGNNIVIDATSGELSSTSFSGGPVSSMSISNSHNYSPSSSLGTASSISFSTSSNDELSQVSSSGSSTSFTGGQNFSPMYPAPQVITSSISPSPGMVQTPGLSHFRSNSGQDANFIPSTLQSLTVPNKGFESSSTNKGFSSSPIVVPDNIGLSTPSTSLTFVGSTPGTGPSLNQIIRPMSTSIVSSSGDSANLGVEIKVAGTDSKAGSKLGVSIQPVPSQTSTGLQQGLVNGQIISPANLPDPGKEQLTQVTQTVIRRIPVVVVQKVPVKVPQQYNVPVPTRVEVPVPQPYPVNVDVVKQIPVEVVKTERVEVERKVPYEVIREVPVEIIKEVSVPVDRKVEVIKKVEVPIEKKVHVNIFHLEPYPVHIIKHVHHNHNKDVLNLLKKKW